MSGWITYPLKKEPERQMPVLFIPALHSKWMLMANDIRENRKPTQEKSASLGFYCGLLAGQTSADYPSLTADLPKYTLDPYDAKFLATPRLLDPMFQVTVVNSGDTGRYRSGQLFPLPGFSYAALCRWFRRSSWQGNAGISDSVLIS